MKCEQEHLPLTRLRDLSAQVLVSNQDEATHLKNCKECRYVLYAFGKSHAILVAESKETATKGILVLQS